MAYVQIALAAWKRRRWLTYLVVGAITIPLFLAAMVAGPLSGLAPASVGGFAPSAFALRDIPPAYLRIYQAAGAAVGWEYLAAIGKIETDHGRSIAAGVRSGVNFAGCCSGPMQFSVIGNPSTWDSYGVDGDHDGHKNVHDPSDAIPAAAAYLKASGAPDDWDSAIFAYNHASWYVAEVKAMAERYRGTAITTGGDAAGSSISQGIAGRRWLTPVPGTGAVCDSRIVPDVVALLRRYKMVPGDCFAMSGHTADGEHPLGLGIDLHPAADGSWDLLGRAARDLGWRESCARQGCAGQLPSPFRFIGWNGYEGHGDPAHAGANAHLHLSWQHTPAAAGTPAARVQTLLAPQ